MSVNNANSPVLCMNKKKKNITFKHSGKKYTLSTVNASLTLQSCVEFRFIKA